MNKDEIHKFQQETLAANAAKTLIQILHFFMAILWIIGLLITVSPNALVIAVGVILILTNIFNLGANIADRVTHNKNEKKWRESVKAELKAELRKEMLSLDLAA